MLEPDALRAFIVIAEVRHFARAADRLGLSQSVISKRLQRLEDQLGARLMERGRRNAVSLTRAGELFLPAATSCLASIEQAARIGANIARGESGPVRIAYVFSAIMTGVLATIVRSLTARLPGIVVEPTALETPAQLAAIADGRIDFGVARPRPSYPERVTAHPIHRERVVLALRSDDPLARSDTIKVADLATQRFIVPQFHEQVGMIEIIRGLARSGNFAMPQILPTADFLTAAGLATAGLGVAAVPSSLRRLNLTGLVYREIADHASSIDLVLLHRSDAPPSALEAIMRGFPLSDSTQGAQS